MPQMISYGTEARQQLCFNNLNKNTRNSVSNYSRLESELKYPCKDRVFAVPLCESSIFSWNHKLELPSIMLESIWNYTVFIYSK